MAPLSANPVEFTLNGAPAVSADGHTLLEALRELGITSAKDGCSPQGQCGCCTVWVDGAPRVACVTPLARVAGRSVTTLESLPDAAEWGQRMCATGGSQCGFCTPGIIMRVAAIPAAQRTEASVRQALLAHLCRCTGWNTIVEAALMPAAEVPIGTGWSRHLGAAAQRAALEGGADQLVSPDVALGHGGFAADTAPADSLVAVLDEHGEWVVGETLAAARAASGKVQGRRTTESLRWPVDLPDGDWVRTLQTTWVEPAYLETDAAWCRPGGDPVGPLCNGGAFGGKTGGHLGAVARRLADEHDRPVLAMYSREDVVRLGAKRPPLAAGVRADGSGVVRVARTPGIVDAIRSVAPQWTVEEVDVVGPSTSAEVRAAGWVEVAALLASDDGWVTAPNGASAQASVDPSGVVHVRVRCGAPLDDAVLRSYCIGAAHMALGWVRQEGITVGDDGVPRDLTIRSFGVLRAVDMPVVHVAIDDGGGDAGEPVNGSDAVFAAVAAAAWRAGGFAPRWPTMRT
ncbi:MAG: 2Fe-2S iron-sulfur cluster binding domain-containing protein [Actinobacteria bacterium]|nr:2Fe-2S iron-sulfur cluster binding domain-containing protein [Actinomycetota bacterium]